ncbi:pirin-like C-terminal cupin domain-containing protein [Sphingomonas nostoxanthinifaciens]|uniref:pirin-like C-terminal cupin domain-containing protein n=1 Tax=Sphingomonas nostoxanthinifaciens TaxID=2872652 RepID=UPI001CC1E42C|nr:pirin-like C-terminal cupin domain-containing protein [Sphingomonas nostoxanthinifaciens]
MDDCRLRAHPRRNLDALLQANGRPAGDRAALGQPSSAVENDETRIHGVAGRRDPRTADCRRQGNAQPDFRRFRRACRPDPVAYRRLHDDNAARGRRTPRITRARPSISPARVISGKIAVAGEVVDQWHLVTFNGDGDSIVLGASTDAVLLFGHADPIGEPVVSHGPFVMNTREEISQAIGDYQAGKFNGTGTLSSVGA